MKNRVNLQRVCRARAKRLGWKITVAGAVLTVYDDRGATLTTGTVEAVADWLTERGEPRPPGPPPEPAPAAWHPWCELFTAEQRAARRSPGTIRTRIAHLVSFAHLFPEATPITATREQLIDWLGRDGIKPRTAHSMRSTARVFWGLLYDLEHRRDNPARTLPSISLPRSIPRPCPDHVVREAFTKADDARVQLALRIAVETGMRRAEVARLNRSDVEGHPGTYQLHVVGKGSHERVVPISDDLAGLILGHPPGYLFTGATPGKPMTPAHLGALMTRVLPGGWTAHTLRHRFASRAYEASRDIRAVQELLGHVSPVTTAIYTKVPDGAMRQAASAAATIM